MKTLIHIETKQSRFLFSDNTNVFLKETMTVSPELIIGDMNISNSVLVNNITPPEDWIGSKYLYDDGTWTLNPDWADPSTPPE